MTQGDDVVMDACAGAFLEFDIQLRLGDFQLDAAGGFDDGITAVFGPSGAGKSTLLACLSGLRVPDSGNITLGGRTLYSSDDKVRTPPQRFRTALVFQDGALFPHMSVRRNIEYGYRMTPERGRFIDVPNLIEFLGLTHLLDRFPETLSGGEVQRVSLARALAMSPRMLMLDEPVASLDIRRRNEVVAYLKRVHHRYQIPMVYVSHSLSDVVALASKAMIIEEGRVKSFGIASDLILEAASKTGGDGDSVDNVFIGEITGPETIRVSEAEIIARVSGRPKGSQVSISIGADEIILASERPESISARNILLGTVKRVIRGESAVFAVVDAGAEFVVELTLGSADEMKLRVGVPVYVIFKTSSISITGALKDSAEQS